MSDDSGEFDAALELCRNAQRRIVLTVLLRDRRELSLNDLTKEIVRDDRYASITDASSEEVNRIHRSLYHQHVPLLLDAEVITYDRERQLVEPTERFDRFQPYFSAIIEADPSLDILEPD